MSSQKVQDEETATEPQAPEREGHLFLGWLDADGLLYDFGSPVYEDIALAANYAKLEEATEYELAVLMRSTDIEGAVAVSFDTGSPIRINSVGGDVKQVTITFSYNPELY